MRFKKYFSNKRNFVQFKNKIKLVPCPFCSQIGYLVLHGPLVGCCLDIQGNTLIRGHRFRCNNRHHRKGCGHTCSILMSYVLKGFQVSTFCLWAFLKAIANGIPKNRLFNNPSFPFTFHCGTRWLNKFKKYQYQIRDHLLQMISPPNINISFPLSQLIIHLKQAFHYANCPISSYQNHFQTTFID